MGERTAAKTVSGMSLLLAVLTFLVMWGGISLLLTDPRGPRLPPPASTPRETLVSLLLFWLPIVTGSIACFTGLMGLSTAGGDLDAQRRATLGVLLGLAPACLAAAWLASVLASP